MLKGYKTYIGIGISLLGVLGFGDVISEGEAVEIVDLAMQLVGLVIAVYGRFAAKLK
jgi:hypothetical protein